MPYKKKAEEYLKIAKDFKLGTLPTESPHPKTHNLSELVHNDLRQSLEIIKEIELDLLEVTREKISEIESLQKEVSDTFKTGGRVFLCGCGATGRLSLALETIWKKSSHKDVSDNVISFMSGGDVALIHSIENFEDYPEYGRRQLEELGFSKNDLLISTTEGGETPFVIGATHAATDLSNRSPYFLYCNPDEALVEVAKRSEEVINHSGIQKINLSVGEMVLAGSTRMQASTILMLSVGIALFNKRADWLDSLTKILEEIDFKLLDQIIETEANIYNSGNSVIYSCDKEYAISVLTDTTERSPTFSLNSFESIHSSKENYSLCYLSIRDTQTIDEAWANLLERSPRTLEWSDTVELTGMDRIKGFDISSNISNRRKEYIQGKDEIFNVDYLDKKIELSIKNQKAVWDIGELDLFGVHMLLKVLLNTHSTLVMGKLGRYYKNIMTWVRPSNNKLIDRTIRYISILLENESIEKSYEEICFELFKQMENASRDEALVLKVFDQFKKN